AARDDTGPDPGLYANLIRASQQSTEPVQAFQSNYHTGESLFRERLRKASRGGGGGGGGTSGYGLTGGGGGSGGTGHAKYFPAQGGGATTAGSPDMVDLSAGQGGSSGGGGYGAIGATGGRTFTVVGNARSGKPGQTKTIRAANINEALKKAGYGWMSKSSVGS
ncbi:hypothetical protein R0J87_18465, partial [Halomonas sp. SIMBA_159]